MGHSVPAVAGYGRHGTIDQGTRERHISLGKRHDQCVEQLNDMVFLIRGELTKLARKSVGALAVIDVHARDVMLKMYEAGVAHVNDFVSVLPIDF